MQWFKYIMVLSLLLLYKNVCETDEFCYIEKFVSGFVSSRHILSTPWTLHTIRCYIVNIYDCKSTFSCINNGITNFTSLNGSSGTKSTVHDYLDSVDKSQKVSSFPPPPPHYSLSRPMASLADVPHKIDYINNFFISWERSNITKPTINANSVVPYLPCLSEAFLYEEILSYRLSKISPNTDGRSTKTLSNAHHAKLNGLHNILHPLILAYRQSEATKKLEMLIASSLISHSQEFDNILSSLFNDHKLDIHLMKLLDKKINEAHNYVSGKGLQHTQSASEKLLTVIKERIIAHKSLDEKGAVNFIQILSECFQNLPNNTRSYLKSKIHRVTDLEDFVEWLQDGIQFCEETKKLTPEKIGIMRELQSDAMAINPVYNQKLDKHSDTDVFVPDGSIQLASYAEEEK